MGDFVKVATKGELPPGTGRAVDVAGTPVALFNVDGALCAVHGVCLHRGGPLGEGELDGKAVTCPWHGWRFDVTTGQCLSRPDAAVERYDVKVEGEDVLVSTLPSA